MESDLSEHREPIFQTEKYGGKRYGFCRPRNTRQVKNSDEKYGKTIEESLQRFRWKYFVCRLASHSSMDLLSKITQ
jgi:hypothetical protein